MTGVARFTELLYGVVGYSTASWPYVLGFGQFWAIQSCSVVLVHSGSTHRTRQGSVRHCRALIPKMFRVDDDDFCSYELG